MTTKKAQVGLVYRFALQHRVSTHCLSAMLVFLPHDTFLAARANFRQ